MSKGKTNDVMQKKVETDPARIETKKLILVGQVMKEAERQGREAQR